MKIEIKPLRKKDHKKAIQFAIKGMHFEWYLKSQFLLNLYGHYFWYLEILRATQVIAAYVDDVFAGVLLAEIKGEDKVYHAFWKALYVKVFDFIAKLFFKGGADVYDQTNKEMLKQYLHEYSPDGEIIFLAANPDIKVKGIGSELLKELEQREKGKLVYLFTDDACTYQFYEHRGFSAVCTKDILLVFGQRKVPLKCFIFSKLLKEEIKIREYQSKDIIEILNLFYDCVHYINAKDYTQKQLDAWTSSIEDIDKWDISFQSHYSLVALKGNRIVGFGDIDDTGYLDHLYVHKDNQKQGIASKLCDILEDYSEKDILSHVSIIAKSFFEHRGYVCERKQQVIRNGEVLTNFVMKKYKRKMKEKDCKE